MKETKIAIDGPAGSGKSTIARKLAEKMDYLYLDTGAMYRALTLVAIEENIDPADGNALAKRLHELDFHLRPRHTFIGDSDVTNAIRTPAVDALVSQVCAHPMVRKEMVRRQREAAQNGHVVMEGRDIGTVVLPDAEIKIFITASSAERAKRRVKQLEAAGMDSNIEEIEKEIIRRDRMDSTREDSPLKKAEDAIEIDNTGETLEESVNRIEKLIEDKISRMVEYNNKPHTRSNPMNPEVPEELNYEAQESPAPEPQPVVESDESVVEEVSTTEPEVNPEEETPNQDQVEEEETLQAEEKPVEEPEEKAEKFVPTPMKIEPLYSEGDIPEDDDLSEDYTIEERQAMLERMEETMTTLKEHEVIEGKVLRFSGDDVVVDIGFKSEGLVSRVEFDDDVKSGDKILVYVEQLEDENGQVVISKRKADFVRVWKEIREAYESGELVQGVIRKRIKGGMVVDIMGVDAFLPGSQIALRQVPDFDALINQKMDFRVIKLNKIRRNIVVSRRIVLEDERSSKRQDLLSEIEEEQVRLGIVKNITDFGVFIDLGGLDGLLHITDMSWSRIKHPGEMLKIGDEINVKILKYDKKKERISLGLKQLTPSPWEAVDEKYPEGARIRGKVVNITKYGAFVELEEGIEGLVHISEMSWTKHINHPSEVLSLSDEIDVVVLSVEKENQKISLGVKQLQPDPWTMLAAKYPPGTKITGVVRNLTSFGAFVEVEEGIDGLVHISDMSWTKRIMHPSEIMKKGEEQELIVLNIDPENRRVSLGLKQLEKDPWPELSGRYSVGRETEGRILRMNDRGVTVKLPDDVEGFVPVTQLGKEVNRPQDAFSEGDLLPLKVLEFDRTERRIVLSVNAFFETKEQTDYDRYLGAHPTNTAAFGDALGEALAGVPKIEEEAEPVI
ncbi:30S ribosomal protein S1, partial [bacterium]|nr:30S ribosomal protein S1 [bacterium]